MLIQIEKCRVHGTKEITQTLLNPLFFNKKNLLFHLNHFQNRIWYFQIKIKHSLNVLSNFRKSKTPSYLRQDLKKLKPPTFIHNNKQTYQKTFTQTNKQTNKTTYILG